VSLIRGANNCYNWLAGLPTPGTANFITKPEPDPIVDDIIISQGGIPQPQLLLPGSSILFDFAVRPKTAVITNPLFEFFVQNPLTWTNSSIQTFNLLLANAKDNIWNVLLSSSLFQANNIIRYRIRWDINGVSTVVSPRPDDPYQWHMIFISPVPATSTPAYHLFITQQDWNQLFLWLQPNDTWEGAGLYLDNTAVSCCNVNPNWNARKPALLGYGINAYEVTARYQGKCWLVEYSMRSDGSSFLNH
jgi:hypothetical protein